MLPAAIVPPLRKHTATVIMLHGLGDSGFGWKPVGEMLQDAFPHVKWVFPHAPEIPVTLNGGMKMPAWYDLISLEDRSKEDRNGMLQTVEKINQLLEQEKQQVDKVVLGGFSQGCAMALLTSATTSIKLTAVMGLSGYFPMKDAVLSQTNQDTPYLLCHGTGDVVVDFTWGQNAHERLKEAKRSVEFKAYPGMGHSTCSEEMVDITRFLKRYI